jgi:uncharacterized repeat protein (TIGR01451 family)
VNVNRRWSGFDVIRVRALVAGLALLTVAGIALGRSPRPLSPAPNSQAQFSPSPKAVSKPAAPKISHAAATSALSTFRHLPLMFEPNVGQTNQPGANFKFMARGSGYSLFLTQDGAVMSLAGLNSTGSGNKLASESLSMKLVGANATASVTGTDLLPGKTNYYVGGDSSQWHSGIEQFARVRYENVYPGVNLVFYGNQGQLEYDFQVAPGADASQPELQFDGAKHLQLREGNLVVRGQGGSVQFEAPHVYQNLDGREQPVTSRFILHADNRVGFEVGPYDHTRELTIDPKLNYSTYFGGDADELCPTFVAGSTGTPGCPAIAVDNGGNIYITGATTSSAGFPPLGNTNPPTVLGTPHVFVAEINPTGGAQGLVYLTFLGGGGTDSPAGIGVDGGGAAYIVGTTSSGINGAEDFPITQTTAYQKTPEAGSTGTSHIFVTVLTPVTGALGNYSTYISGNGTDIASGMAIDSQQDVFITGTTTSQDVGTSIDEFPATNLPQALPFQQFPRAPIQFFMTKVNTAAPGSSSISYSTYFGGETFNTANAIAIGGGITVDSTGNVFFSGTTNFVFSGCTGCQSSDFPILNAYQPCLDQAPPTTIINPVTCTYGTPPTASDAFIAKMNPNAQQGQQLIWSTYFGGSDTDTGTAIAVDPGAANVYITGSTNSPDVTTSITTSAFQAFQLCLNTYPNPTTLPCPTTTAATDAYVARLSNPTTGAMSLGYFSYLGGSGSDAGQGIAIDSANGALVTGWTQSSNFPVVPNPSTIQSVLKGPQDAFLARINTVAGTGQTNGSYASYFGGSGIDQGTSITLDTDLNTYFTGTTNSTDLQTTGSLALQPVKSGGFDAFAVQLGTSADLAITGILSVPSGQTFVSAGNQATFIYTVTNNGPDLATNVTVTDELNGSSVPLTFDSASVTSGTCNSSTTGSNPNVVCNITSLQAGSTATVTIVLTPTKGGSFNGGHVAVSAANNNDPIPGNNIAPPVDAQASDFSINVGPANETIPAAGDTAPYTVLLAPLPIYTSSISFSCAQLPSAATCTFTPSSVTLNSSSQGSTALNISTTARPTPAVSLHPKVKNFYALWLGIPVMALFGLGSDPKRRRKLGKITGALLLGLLFGVILLQPACKSKTQTTVSSGTPPGAYTIIVTASSGSLSHSSSITLNVP